MLRSTRAALVRFGDSDQRAVLLEPKQVRVVRRTFLHQVGGDLGARLRQVVAGDQPIAAVVARAHQDRHAFAGDLRHPRTMLWAMLRPAFSIIMA